MSSTSKLTDFQGLVEEFKQESDRAAVIVSAAFLDARLRDTVENFLIDDDKEGRNLFDGMGPLSSFGAKIRLAYCLGLLRTDDYADLRIIQKVRNAFAHQLHGLSFADEQIADQCRRLRGPQATLSVESARTYTPRDLFLFTVAGLNAALSAAKFFTTADKKRCVVPDTSSRAS